VILLLAVHGSLARAGKVKSRTPKVDKQEKKKTPKGRAKKRLIYNRRYVFLDFLIAQMLTRGGTFSLKVSSMSPLYQVASDACE
jgi:ribosomal protein S30